MTNNPSVDVSKYFVLDGILLKEKMEKMRPLQAQRIIYNFSIMFLCLDIKNMEHVAIMKKSWGLLKNSWWSENNRITLVFFKKQTMG